MQGNALASFTFAAEALAAFSRAVLALASERTEPMRRAASARSKWAMFWAMLLSMPDVGNKQWGYFCTPMKLLLQLHSYCTL